MAACRSLARAALCGQPGSAWSGSDHPNEAWWTHQVCCAKAEIVDKKEPSSSVCERYYTFDRGAAEGLLCVRNSIVQLREPPYLLLGRDAHRMITAYMEVRQPYWRLQPNNWITYHSFTILEIDGGVLFMLIERKTDLLEIVIGDPGIPLQIMKAFRAHGGGRNPSLCIDQPRKKLQTRVSVHQLLEWIDGPVEESWQHYDMLSANCQHFSTALHDFLTEPYVATRASNIMVNGLPDNRDFVQAAIRKDWHSLKYAAPQFREDRIVVLNALEQDGRALRYAHIGLRLDREVVLAAVQQNGYALPYVEGHLRQDKEVVMAAVQQRGQVLCYAAEKHRRDRSVALKAVKQDAYALRYVAGKLKWDAEVLLRATLQNPFAVARMPLC